MSAPTNSGSNTPVPASRVSAEDFSLDTKNMGEAAAKCKTLAEKMQELKKDLEESKNSLLWVWTGKARNEFEKTWRLLQQQFGDITADLWDMYESILEAEEAYIQVDVNFAKQEDDRDNRVYGK